MRMRKKKWALPYVSEDNKVMVHEPSNYKGQWNNICNSKICVEIGIGMGGYIQAMAKLYPEYTFVGIEKDINCLAVALKSINEDGINNIRLINNDAAIINEWFDQGEIETIYMNFSDPWPKKAHTKRRLSSSSFIEKYDTILKDDGCIVMKTDNKSLFEYSLISFLDYGLKLIEFNVDFRSQDNNDPITEYEQKFMDLKQPIYRMKLLKEEKCEQR